MTLLQSRVMALSPSGQADPSVVVAGCRAGALGVFDYGLGDLARVELGTLDAASRFLKDRSFGIRLTSSSLNRGLPEQWPANLRVLVVAECGGEDWGRLRGLWSGDGRLAMAEVTSRESARVAAAAGFDAVIVAGNEASGRGGDESTFILLQAALALGLPRVWVRGGIGPSSASACVAAGATGVVLDGALLLARESPIIETIREQVARWDGGETVVIGRKGGRLRVQADPGSPALARLRQAADDGSLDHALLNEVGWGPGQVRPVGQDAALAARLARSHVTVGGIVQAVERAIDESLSAARSARPLAEGSPLAQAHGTAYPVVQGPMTRVSDLVPFAEAVADGGGLPFLALALMRGDEAARLLDQASTTLGERPWGVGILGFVPPELRLEQIEQIRRVRPRFALIAGGRPDQARELEREGIATYLHAPSPGLLRQFWNDGARRFVLEGRECGGHVGPRSSMLLWEQGVDVILEALERGGTAGDVHVLFAGGVHDARSAAAVAALGAPLARRGAKIGVLIGTAYLFTAEAVATGAILPGFQAEALRCRQTVLLETGPGHEVRVSPTAFVETFEQERKRLIAEGWSAEEVRVALENLNAGRLRIAAKGIERVNGADSPLVAVGEEGQLDRGLYMLGQAATLRHEVTSIAELHRQICAGGTARIEQLAAETSAAADTRQATPSDIAIVGMSAIVPGAGDVRTFWENTLRGHDAITEVPEDRWDWRLYYDPNDRAGDKITSKWGGFVPDVPFNPLRYGMPPASLPSVEPMHLLTLEAVRAALDDAGYRDRPFPRDRTAVVLGAGGGAAQLAMGYAFRSYLPLLDTVAPGAGREALERAGALLPEWTEDSFPGILLNVAAGRVANRFDLGGANYTVDAACGSSLAAASVAVRELESGAADVVILGGADTVQNPFTYLAFSKTHAFSPRGRCRPFDDGADGIVISEAVAVVVLKRLADAERDGDRIYAVLKGLGASSDGRAKGLTAPRPEGQVSALKRAYNKAGIDPATVGYVEAHGTGTAAGDLAEVEALTDVFRESGAEPGRCALGSVKSLVGHTKCAAGLVGLINATLALHHEVLPPTIGVNRLNRRARLDESPFHVSTSTRPWLHADRDRPRRAGVSAFGFGGTNFHAVLEAYQGGVTGASAPVREWPAELLTWRAPDRERLIAALDRLGAALDRGRPSLRDLAHTLQSASSTAAGFALAIVASSHEDLERKLAEARAKIAAGSDSFHDPRGIDFAASPDPAAARVAFLFPGQGAQRLEMLGELAVLFPEVRGGFESFDAVLSRLGRGPIGPRVFPPHAFSEQETERQRLALAETDIAQPALGAACVGMLRLLEALGVVPEMVAGHSYGELVALHAAGAFSLEALVELSEARGRLIRQAAGDQHGAMAALAMGPNEVSTLLEGLANVAPVNWNGPRQTVISGNQDEVGEAVARARRAGVRAQKLSVSCAFHTPMVAGASGPLAGLAATLGAGVARCPVFSNTTAARYSSDPATIGPMLGEHLARPVRFAEMIEAMHADGARTFVEVGPGATLTPLVESILSGRPHVALACDPGGRPGVPGLLQTLARLFVAGVPIKLGRLTAGREVRLLDRTSFTGEPNVETNGAAMWLVNGTRARPASAAEPRRLGPGPALPAPAPTPAPAPNHVAVPSEPHRNGHVPTPSKNGNGVLNGHKPMLPNKPAIEPAPGVDRVVEAFQKTMQTFLEVQRDTMLALLGSHQSDASIEVEPPTVPSAAPRAPEPAVNPNREAAVHTNGHSEAAARPKPSAQAPADRATQEGKANGAVDVAAKLLAIVRERTGYPAEMLRLDLDLEADLGIDSIKRVEILGSLKDALPASSIGSSSEMMDQLSRARTLGAIVERVERSLSPNGKHPSHPEGQRNGSTVNPPAQPAKRGERDESPVRRMTVRAVDRPLNGPMGDLGLARGGLVLITDDQRGIARALAADLKAKGHPAVVIAHAQNRSDELSSRYPAVDLTSPVAVEALLARLRSRGPIAGLIHLLPLGDARSTELDRAAWSDRMGPEVHGLFLLARAAADDLVRAAEQGGACLIACTAMGGGFGSLADGPDDFFPGHGAIGGMVKTLAREWPSDVRVRVVDLDAGDDVELLAANLVHEVGTRQGGAEVGYIDRRRIALRVVDDALHDHRGGEGVELAPGEPVIVTGGARGITAAVAADMARRWRPTFLLLGTSPLPRGDESRLTAGVTCPATLKSILHQGLARDSAHVGPADLERAYQALRRQREIRANLERLRAAGAHVEYASADVRDADALSRIVSKWQGRFGPIRGLVHGAGVIQDKLLRDKSPESFERVLSTKLDGALNLAGLVDPERLRFAAFFSSVAGRFGNRGQADYAAANEALNKLALWLDRRWPCRVVSVIWGPWSGVGMVSDLEGHLGRRGLGMITPSEGAHRLTDELALGRKGDVEVLIAGEIGPLLDGDDPRNQAAHAPDLEAGAVAVS